MVALLYKNFILGKRLWRSTLCYMLMPLVMIIIFGVIATATATSGEIRDPAPFVEFSSVKSTASTITRGLPACRVFDVTGGRYGAGVPLPNTPCVTLAYSPSTNADVVQIMT